MFKKYLTSLKNTVDENLFYHLTRLEYPNIIADGMRYAVLNGGKRLRPIFLLMVCELYGKNNENVLSIASAIEMIHSYSLVHDDLPAIDNDDYRRGNLTTHKKYGEAEAILIGDALLTHSFSLITSAVETVSADKIVKIVHLTSTYSGINGMIGGQMIDIESEGKNISIETLKYIHSHKTGKLIKLPFEIGAIICDAVQSEYDALASYAEKIGLAFQIKDDILDIEGEFDKIGKPVGSDLKLKKTTYPSIYGIEESKKILEQTIIDAKEILNIFPVEKVQNFYKLADYIMQRES